MGILAHSTSRISNPRFIEGNLPGQAVRVADKIEYRIVDFDELKTVLAPPKEPIVAGFFRLKFRDKIKLIINFPSYLMLHFQQVKYYIYSIKQILIV